MVWQGNRYLHHLVDLLGRRAAQSHPVTLSEADDSAHHHGDLARVCVHGRVSVLGSKFMPCQLWLMYIL